MRKCVFVICLVWGLTPLFGQQITFPQFKTNSQSSFQNYIFTEMRKQDKILSKFCDVSLGTIRFTLNTKGGVETLDIKLDTNEDIRTILHDIILSAQWSPMKSNDKNVKSLPLVLPVYIVIEAGCENGYVRREELGIEKDFKEMFLMNDNEQFLDCLLLEPFSYNLPAGFLDLNPRKH